jgi:hypothetical protein
MADGKAYLQTNAYESSQKWNIDYGQADATNLDSGFIPNRLFRFKVAFGPEDPKNENYFLKNKDDYEGRKENRVFFVSDDGSGLNSGERAVKIRAT